MDDPEKNPASRRHKYSQIDRSWAWVVLFASIVLQAISSGVLLGSGVYVSEWIIVFKSTPSVIGLISSIGVATFYLCSKYEASNLFRVSHIVH